MDRGLLRNDIKLKEETVKIKSVKQKQKLPDGIYLNGAIEDLPVIFTADTGASKTVISSRIYGKIPIQKRPKLIESPRLVGPGGISLGEKGKAVFNIKLGSMQLNIEAIVAEIEDDGLLGIDVLQNGDGGPADIILSKGLILINGAEVPVIQMGLKNRVRRVTAADHFVIPAQSEAIIDVYVEREEDDDEVSDSEYLIEPTEHFQETYPLQMAATLVDINNGATSKVRVLNPFPTAMSIKQDVVVGTAEPIEGYPTVLSQQESESERDNLVRVRRVQLSADQINNKTNDQNVSHTKECENLQVPSHLQDMYEKATQNCEPHQKQLVAKLLTKYENAFSKNEWDLGTTNLAEHSIDTGEARPVKQQPRRVPLAYAEEEKKAIEDMLAKGVIRKSTSPWASPIVLVRKKPTGPNKVGAIRPCVDYRRVNALVKPDGFPLPRIQDCLDAVAGSTLFSTFDLTSGYFQIPLKEEDIPKSAFVCKYGHFEMTKMPFGLNNAASTFQRTMELVLQGLQWETCLIYIDDVIVYGKNFDEHLLRIDQVLERIQGAGLKFKPSKCEMLQDEVVFLGHVVSGAGVKPNPVNISKIIEWPQPKTGKEVKQFVAMGSYYRRYVKDFASIAKPMLELTKKGKEFLWDNHCDLSFSNLKKALVSSDVMGYPLNEGGEFILDVDACDVGIGGVLHQIQDGRERVIAYASRALNKAERNYCITEKELLAVRYFVEYFRQYLLGRKFLVRSDHQALVYLFSLKEPRGKTARWIEVLAHYDFSIEYRPGKKQGHCDALSRCENPKDCSCPDVDMDEALKCGPCKKCLKRAQDMLLQGHYDKVTFPEQQQQS